MRRVIIESPFAGKTPAETATNLLYVRAAMRDCILRGDAPFASHALYTQAGVLRDEIPAERGLGMRAGLSWTPAAEAVVVYTDRGISSGMQAGIGRANKANIPLEYRTIPNWNDEDAARARAYEPTNVERALVMSEWRREDDGWKCDACDARSRADFPAGPHIADCSMDRALNEIGLGPGDRARIRKGEERNALVSVEVEELADLLLAAGVDLTPEALVANVLTEEDANLLAAWARATHIVRTGENVTIPKLLPYLSKLVGQAEDE